MGVGKMVGEGGEAFCGPAFGGVVAAGVEDGVGGTDVGCGEDFIGFGRVGICDGQLQTSVGRQGEWDMGAGCWRVNRPIHGRFIQKVRSEVPVVIDSRGEFVFAVFAWRGEAVGQEEASGIAVVADAPVDKRDAGDECGRE